MHGGEALAVGVAEGASAVAEHAVASAAEVTSALEQAAVTPVSAAVPFAVPAERVNAMSAVGPEGPAQQVVRASSEVTLEDKTRREQGPAESPARAEHAPPAELVG